MCIFTDMLKRLERKKKKTMTTDLQKSSVVNGLQN